MRRTLRSIAVSAAVTLAVLGPSAPAQAKVIDSGTFSGTDSGVVCGSYAVETTFGGSFTVKDATPATDGQLFAFTMKFEFTDVITNPETGAFVTLSGHFLLKEIRPRQLDGSVYTLRTIEVGRLVLRDMDGKTVLKDVGLIETTEIFDTLGDSAPGGVLLEGPEIVRVAGPHPALEDTFDPCLLFDELIG
jgi:hypothetical protein